MNNSKLNNTIEILCEKINKYQKISFKGKLVYTTMQDAKKRIYSFLEEAQGYIIDMEELEQIDSTGFGVLVNMGKKIIEINSSMVIIVKDELIRELFEISKIDLVFPVVETQEKALNLLNSGVVDSALKIQKY